jgi:hypothetical protein
MVLQARPPIGAVLPTRVLCLLPVKIDRHLARKVQEAHT